MKVVSSVLSFGPSRPAKSVKSPRLFISVWWCVMAGLGILPYTFRAWSADCVTPPAGLVAWWPGQGNANDIASTNNGTLSGGASFASGEVGQAFSFDGVNGYVEVPSNSNLNPAASFSIEGWIYPRKDQTQAIMSKWADTPDQLNQRSYGFNTCPNEALQFAISDWAHQWDASFQVFNTTNNVFVLNTWSHVAAVYDQPAGARRIYVNGVKVAERIDPPITVTNSTARVGIGANLFSATGSRGYFDGLIDELSFYSGALSTAEIQAIYNAGSAGKCRSAECVPPPAGLVSWWPGEGNANDIAGTNSGVLEGGVAFVAGEVGQGFSFNGISSMVTNTMPGLTNIRNSYTMEFWAWPTASRASTPEATSGFAGVSDQRYAIFPGVGVAGFAGAGVSVGTNGVSVFECASSYMPSLLVYDTPIIGWTHIAVVHQNRQAALYINGVLVRSGLVSGTDSYPSTCLGEMGLGFGYYAGLLDEVSIYSRALSSPEVQAIYHAGSAGKCRSAECVPPPAGLVSWWPGEGNVNDIAGANDGTLSNGAGFASGMVGQAFSFDGINDYVRIPKSASLDAPNQLTIDFWMKADPSQPIGSQVVGLVTSDFYGFEIGTAASKVGVVFFVSTDNGAHFVSTTDLSSSGAAFPAGEWHHIAGVYDGAGVQLYLDGQALGNPAPVTGQISPMLANSFLAIGSSDGRTTCGQCSGSRYFKGIIDEVDFFNRALSVGEIAAIYHAGAAGKCLTLIPPFVSVQPTNQTVVAGADATFSAVAGGTSPLTYQWRFGGTNIAGATGTSLTLSNVQPVQAGIYAVLVTNAYGSTNSVNAILTVTPSACEPPPSSLISWWRGEGDCLDAVGTNDGTLQNGATFAPGLVGQGFAFDGVNDYVKVPRAPGLDVGGQVTIDLWMKADPSTPIGSRLAGLVVSDYYGMEISYAPAGVFLFISTDNGAHFATTADTNGGGAMFPAGEWHHVAGSYDGTKLQFYLDGQPWGKATLAPGSISPMLASSFVTIGSEDGKTSFPFVIGTRYFKGLLDEVDIFNRALSASEIAAIYNAGSAGKCRPTPIPHGATAAATLVNGFVVGVAVTDGGWGYTSTPVVRISGAGGSGARAIAVVSNGMVIAVNILDAGSGYTSPPLVVIEPPFIPSPVLDIAPMSFLAFSNLTHGSVYQLQQWVGWYWSNQGVSFTATNAFYTQMVAGVADGRDYRLARSPFPAQAFATAQVVNGFVVGATVTSSGSGYVTSPAVTIVGGDGTNAVAVSHVSGGKVTSITIIDAGIGYTSTPTIRIAPPPPGVAVSPTVRPVMQVDSANLAPYHNYQIQFKPVLGGAWGNWNGGLFSPTDVTNSQYLFITNGIGFFRLQNVP